MRRPSSSAGCFSTLCRSVAFFAIVERRFDQTAARSASGLCLDRELQESFRLFFLGRELDLQRLKRIGGKVVADLRCFGLIIQPAPSMAF